ncbi:hypothetical protein IW262DRAFT_1456998 [Armillaria fumosa]|nr:hypothetical protein IW262DRAFT_1456998 [Armillaria fumosa]
MAPTFDATCDFHKALRELQYCLDHEADSSNTAMHTTAWVRSAYVTWRCLQLTWLSEEEGFMDDQAWWGIEEQLWLLLSSVNVDLVRDSHEEYEFLANEAAKSGIQVASLPASSAAQEISASESEVVALLVLPSVPTGGEQVIRTPLSMDSPVFPDLPNFPVAPSHRPQGDSGSEFELPNSLRLSPTARTKRMASLRVNNTDRFRSKYGLQQGPSSTPQIEVSPSKRARTSKGKKDKKNQGSSKDASAPKKRGHPRKIRDDKPTFKRRGGLGEPIPKNAVEVADPHLQPTGLLVPDKDFGDYVGCNDFYFARPLGELVGHLMQEPCDACYRAGAQCCTVHSKSFKCFRCMFMKHPCVVHREDNYVNTVEQVFEPSISLADSINHDLEVLLDKATQLLDPTIIKCSILHEHVAALQSLAELIGQGMRLTHKAEEKNQSNEESDTE